MKIIKMIRGFFLKTSRSYKIMQNVIFHVKLLSPTLKHIRFLFIKLDGYSGFLRIEKLTGVRVKDISFVDKEYMLTFIKKK